MPEKIHLKVTGMTCEHCVMRVTKAAESIEGVSDVKVDLASGSLDATVDSADAVERIREAVADAGYQTAG
jgi:copper ion binding protein